MDKVLHHQGASLSWVYLTYQSMKVDLHMLNYTAVTWVVATHIFFSFHPYLGKIPILTNIFQMGWNQQLVTIFLALSNIQKIYLDISLLIIVLLCFVLSIY